MKSSSPEDFPHLSDILQSGNPDSIRQNALNALCKISGASSGCLLVLQTSIEFPQKEFLSGRPVDSAAYRPVIERFLHSEESCFDSPTKPYLILLKLLYRSDPTGVIILVFDNPVSRTGILPMLTPAWTLMSVYEENQKLLMILETSQKHLQNLSLESTEIAKRNAQLFQQLLSNENRLRSLSKGVIRMQEEERAKISRELHDGIGQALTGLKMNLDLLSQKIGESISADCQERLKEAQRQAEQSLEDVRELSRLLRPRMLDDLGLLPTLRWYVRTFSQRTGIHVTLKTKNTRARLDPETETMLFRIAQEGLNNILKHSKAQSASVRLRCTEKDARLEISDTGVGFERETKLHAFSSGSGLSGIADRISLSGGKFSLSSRAGSGTRLRVRIPFNNRRSEKKKTPDG